MYIPGKREQLFLLDHGNTFDPGNFGGFFQIQTADGGHHKHKMLFIRTFSDKSFKNPVAFHS